MTNNIKPFITRAALTLALAMLTAATGWATETSTITVGSTDYTLFTGFTATDGNGRNYAKLVDGNTSTDWSATKNDDDPNAPANDFAGGTDDPAFVEFHADEAFIPKGYVLTCYHENAGFWKPVEWALKAKLNEGDGWTTIQSSTTTLGQGKTFEIACDNDGDNEYQYFRFEVYEVGTTDVVDLDELQFYGLLPTYTHLTVKAATCMATGIKVDCYRRNSDGKYFTDNTGTTELQESDVIAPIIPHTGEHHEATDVNIEYWQCSMCGKYFSDSGYTTEITEEQTKIYRTITIDGSISGLVTVAFSKTQALAGETVCLYISDLIDASTLKVNDGAVELTAKTGIQYTFTMPAADVTVTADVAQSNADGDVLTGSIRHTVTIPDGASITLNNATITGSIVCEGSATITLVGTNSVSGANNKAGIQIGGSGTTLTINGDGTLTANGGSQSAGIGLSRAWNVTEDVVGGNIVINGGNITANGGGGGAGIGAGVTKDPNNSSSRKAIVGTITIAGGSLTAVGGSNADGIGAGQNNYNATIQIGTVTIYDGIDKVDASSIKDFGSVVYMHGETNVTASKTDYFAIGEDGNRRLIAQKPAIAEIPDQSYTGSEITPEPTVTIGSLTLTKSTDYEYSYTNNTNVGTATVTVTFQGDYASLGSVEKEFTIAPWSGSGIASDPFIIENPSQLLLLAHRVNGTNGETANDYAGMYFKLGADITFSHDANEGDDYAENYEAIGGYIGGTIRYFLGDFDGDGHTVSGIRIRKDGSGNTYIDQGLFGCIGSDAEIHDVHLTDARITGYQNVGGIAGYNNQGYIKRCSVTDSYITANGNWVYGTICGGTSNTSRLTNNYYHGCTVNGTENATNVGCCDTDIADIAANNGALPAYRLDLGANITTPPGTFAGQTEWLTTPPVNPRLAPENGFTLAGNHYFASGYVFTPGSTLASGAAQGYTPRATLGGQLLDLYTPTGDADLLAGKAIARLTITADCDGKTLAAALRSDGLEHEVSYINADGTTGEASAVALDGTETTLAAGTYFAGLENVNFDHTVNLTGDVTLILKDGCTMNVGESDARISGKGIASPTSGTNVLTIYGQSGQTGNLNIYSTSNAVADYGSIAIFGSVNMNGGNVTVRHYGDYGNGIYANSLTVNGGNVDVKSDQNIVVCIRNAITINGGTVIADGYSTGLQCTAGSVTVNGGTVNATGKTCGILADGAITLGWTRPTDRITASSYSGTVQVVSGKKLHNGSSFLDGTLGDPATALNGKTLRPAATATYTTADGTAATADAILLDASDNNLPAGNYLATGTLNYTHGITLTGNVTLILADNCHMNVGTSGERIDGRGIDGPDPATGGLHDLTITSQSLGDNMGALNIYTTGSNNAGIRSGALTINGGNITADTNGKSAIALNAGGALTINGGTVTATTAGTTAHAIAAAGDFKYNGGNVTATAPAANAIRADIGNYTFSWRTPADRITIGATGLYAPAAKTATFTRLFTDGSGNIYTGTLTGTEINALKSVTLQPCTEVTVTMNANGIRTYASKVALDFSQKSSDNSSAELSAYIVSAFDGTAGMLTLSSVDIVPAETGLLLKGTPSTTFTVPLATSASAPSPNYLHGVTDDATVVPQTENGNTNFILANGSYGIDWYTLSEAGAIGANKAYLSLPTASLSNSAAGFQWVYEGETTKIERPTPGPSLNGGEWYDMSGRKLNSKPTAKGIYIRNGVKVVIK